MGRLSLALFPHKGIRNMFSQLLVLTGSIDYSNPENVTDMHNFGRFFFNFLEQHSDDENTVVLPELEKKVPGSSAHDMAEHEEIEAEQLKLKKMLAEIHRMSLAGENPDALGFKFYFELSKFQSLYFMHMYGEETETQNQLWANFTDEELIAMRTKIISRIKPDFFFKVVRISYPCIDPC